MYAFGTTAGKPFRRRFGRGLAALGHRTRPLRPGVPQPRSDTDRRLPVRGRTPRPGAPVGAGPPRMDLEPPGRRRRGSAGGTTVLGRGVLSEARQVAQPLPGLALWPDSVGTLSLRAVATRGALAVPVGDAAGDRSGAGEIG